MPGAEKAIYEILEWLGLLWDEKYIQSERLSFYKDVAEDLMQRKLAKTEEGAIRFIVPKGKTIAWLDAVGNKNISFKSEDVEDFVILKSDGFPTYHLANVVDDHLMKVSHVIRGDEWISSTPKHILLYEAFGWDIPIFAHLPVILGPDHKKLSKRHNAKSALDYRDEGYLKEALLNYMVLLGWNPGGDREIMTLREMVDLFDLQDVNTASPIFDSKKLEWFNGLWIRKSHIANLRSQIVERAPKLKTINEALLDKLIRLAQTRAKTIQEFEELMLPFLHPRKDIKLIKEEKEFKRVLKARLANLSVWEQKDITDAISEMFLAQTKVKNYKMFYKILIGVDRGLPIAAAFEIIGRDRSLEMLSTE